MSGSNQSSNASAGLVVVEDQISWAWSANRQEHRFTRFLLKRLPGFLLGSARRHDHPCLVVWSIAQCLEATSYRVLSVAKGCAKFDRRTPSRNWWFGGRFTLPAFDFEFINVVFREHQTLC